MKVDELTSAYLMKASVRLDALGFYRERQAYSDVVREAQSVVELTLKALLRAAGVEVPKIQDVGRTLSNLAWRSACGRVTRAVCGDHVSDG